MSQYLYLVLLVMTSYGLSRSRERFFGDSRETYNKLMAGLASWGLLLLITSIAQSDLINQIPILSDDQYRYPIEALLLVAGGTFIVAALFTWLPQLIRARENTDFLQARVTFANEITRSLKHNSGELHDLERMLTRLFKFTSVDTIAITKPDTDSALPLVSVEDRLAPFYETLTEGNHVFLAEGFGSHGCPVALIPYLREEDSIAVFVGKWSAPESVTDLVLDNLQLTAEILMINASRALAGSASSAAEASPYQQLFDSLRTALVDIDRIPDAMRPLYDGLKGKIDFDLLRIAVFDQRGYNVTQHCLAGGKTLLSERDRSVGTQKSQLGLLFAEPQIVFSEDIKQSEFEDDRWLASCGTACALTIPLISRNTVIAAVTLASSSNSLSRELGEEIAVGLTELLLPVVKSDLAAHQLVTYNRQILDLTSALKTIVSGSDHQTMIGELLEMLVKKIPTTYCRLWRYDSLSESLDFVADSRSRDIGAQNQPQSSVALDRVHWHRQAVTTGRVMVINQREARMQMDEDEESLALIRGTRSALIIPLIAGGKTIGVISLAELRCWERNNFSLSETLFARALANIVAEVMAVQIYSEEAKILRSRLATLQQRSNIGELFTELPQRLATPLTSIMARTDQLINSVAVRDEVASKHLLSIKRQTEKIVGEVRNIQEARRTLTTSV